ncbi:MAG: hypothetical protein ABR977_08415 [Candidatus Dormibacteria bacterium]
MPDPSGGGWIRLICGYCGRLALLPSAGAGVGRETGWICPHCSPGPRSREEWTGVAGS